MKDSAPRAAVQLGLRGAEGSLSLGLVAALDRRFDVRAFDQRLEGLVHGRGVG